jgi:hypothetical protein
LFTHFAWTGRHAYLPLAATPALDLKAGRFYFICRTTQERVVSPAKGGRHVSRSEET